MAIRRSAPVTWSTSAVIGSCPRGEDVAGVIRDPHGPGGREEHPTRTSSPATGRPRDLESPLRANGSHDFRRLAGLLRSARHARQMGLRHAGLALPDCAPSPIDRLLSATPMGRDRPRRQPHRTGLFPAGRKDDAARWIAIRHGPDHIHLVARRWPARTGPAPASRTERYRVRDAASPPSTVRGAVH